MTLIVLFIACELGPIFISLDYSLLSIIGLSDTSAFGGLEGPAGLGGVGQAESLLGDGGYDPLPDAGDIGRQGSVASGGRSVGSAASRSTQGSRWSSTGAI